MSSEEKSKQSKIIGIVVRAIVFGLVSYGVKSFFKEDLETEIQKVVKKINANAPTIVDEYTRLDSVALTGKRQFEYYYTVKNMSTERADKETIKTVLKSAILDELKRDENMEAFRKYDFTLGYNYYDEQGNLIVEIQANPEEYK